MKLQGCYCRYCAPRKGFPVLWELKPDLGWLEIPKNASKVIKEFNKGRKEIKDLTVEYPAVVAVIRTPISRFKSLYNHYFIDGYRKSIGLDWARRQRIDMSDPYKSETIQNVLDKLDTLASKEEVHHFYPQSYFIPKGIKNLKLIPISEVTTWFDVPIKNNSKFKKIELTKDQKEFLKELYKEDLDLL